MYGRRLAILLIGLATLGAQAVGAQGQWVQRYVGRLQWISASSVMVIAPPNGPSIAIDLTRVPQGQYSSLEAGEWVVVTGEAYPEYHRVIGYSVQRLGETRRSVQSP
jgi:hypothetical protein